MTMNAVHTQILDAYERALAGRNPASIDVLELLPAIERAVPRATIPYIIAALKAAAAQQFREAEQLQRYVCAKRGKEANARVAPADLARPK